jgi:hypothetical protein
MSEERNKLSNNNYSPYSRLDDIKISVGDDRIVRINQDLQEIKTNVHQSIDSLLQRGELIDNLVDKSQHLKHNAGKFKKHATKLRRYFQCEYYKTKTFWVLLLLALVGIILLIIYLS